MYFKVSNVHPSRELSFVTAPTTQLTGHEGDISSNLVTGTLSGTMLDLYSVIKTVKL